MIALDVATEAEALVELALFIREPLAYQTARQQRAAKAEELATKGARLDAESIGDFLAYCKGEKLSDGYVKYTLAPYLREWALALGGKELRKVDGVRELRPILERWKTAGHKRVIALKAFTAWAREEAGKLARRDDPTLDLKVPSVKGRPMAERAFTAEQIEKFYAVLTDYSFANGYDELAHVPEDAPQKTIDLQPIRDVFVLRAKCGMHGTEIERLARGEGAIRVLEGAGEIVATLVFPHKNGGEHVVSVDAQALAAAQRLRALGKTPSRVTTGRAVRRIVTKHPGARGVRPREPPTLVYYPRRRWASRHGESWRGADRGSQSNGRTHFDENYP